MIQIILSTKTLLHEDKTPTGEGNPWTPLIIIMDMRLGSRLSTQQDMDVRI